MKSRPQTVEDYKMEKIKLPDETSKSASSGVQWFTSLFGMVLIGLFAYGIKRRSL